jgi:thiamine pyrophosphokinase
VRALIITGGTLLDTELVNKYRHNHDLIICADAGANYLAKAQITPDVLVGDFDSIDSEVLDNLKKINVKIIKYPIEKDCTDTQLALKYAFNLCCSAITILGGIGDRIDHTLANIYLMLDVINRDIDCIMENDYCKIILSKGYVEIHGNLGDTISLLPLTDKVEGIDIEGFKYPISNGFMEKQNPYGISNILDSVKATISHKVGILAVIYAKKT